MKNACLSMLFFLSSTLYTYAQIELSNFNATGRAGVSTTLNTDYQATGINPANLGLKPRYENKSITFGLAEFATNAYMEGVTLADVQKYFAKDLSKEEQIDAVSKFTNMQFSINSDINIFGFSFQKEKLGGFAFNVRDQFRESHKFSQTTTDYLFRGSTSIFFDQLILNNGNYVPNDPSQYAAYDAIGIAGGYSTNGFSLGQVVNGTFIKAQWYREYALSYGRELINKNDGDFTLAGGAGIKYIQGIAYLDIEGKNNRLYGKGAFSNLFSLDDYFTFTKPKTVASGNMSPLGSGYGLDLGATVTLKKIFRFGAAVTNIGKVVYKSNAFEVQDTVIQTVTYPNSGFDLSKDLVKWRGIDNITTTLPTNLRVGSSIHLLKNRLDAGVDVIIPLNKVPGAFVQPQISIGGDFYPVRWVKLSSGMFIGGNTAAKANIPFGITFIAGENGTYEMGLATRDVVTYIKKDSPSYSAAFGFLRFRF